MNIKTFMVLANDPQSLLMALPFWLVGAWLGWLIGGIKYEGINLRHDSRYRIVWLFRNVARWR